MATSCSIADSLLCLALLIARVQIDVSCYCYLCDLIKKREMKMINTKLMLLAAAALIGTAACYTTYSGAFCGLSSDAGVCMTRDCCSDKPHDYAARYVSESRPAANKSGCEGCTDACCSDCSTATCCGGTGCDCCGADVCTSCDKDAAAAAAAIPVNIGEAGCCKNKVVCRLTI